MKHISSIALVFQHVIKTQGIPFEEPKSSERRPESAEQQKQLWLITDVKIILFASILGFSRDRIGLLLGSVSLGFTLRQFIGVWLNLTSCSILVARSLWKISVVSILSLYCFCHDSSSEDGVIGRCYKQQKIHCPNFSLSSPFPFKNILNLLQPKA